MKSVRFVHVTTHAVLPGIFRGDDALIAVNTPVDHEAVEITDGNFTLPDLTTLPLEARAARARIERDWRLQAADWTQLPDTRLTGPQRVAWTNYRNALRDLTADPNFPDVTWPTPPSV